jgi:uncharacterized membrane protein
MPKPAPHPRVPAIDAARGVALCGMACFHIAWDLGVFGLIALDVAADPGWLLFARLVAGSFLALSGVSLSLATRDRLRPGHYMARVGRIAAAAALVSLASWWFDPAGFIIFGILHCMALSTVLALPLLFAPTWVVAALAGVMLVGAAWLRDAAFNDTAWLFLGLATKVPRSADYIPLFPWFGVVLLGMLAGRWLLRDPDGGLWRWRARAPAWRVLAWAGRHSLAIYLLHQPILIGLLMAATTLLG